MAQKSSLQIYTFENKICLPRNLTAGHFQHKVKAGSCSVRRGTHLLLLCSIPLAKPGRLCWYDSATNEISQQALALALNLQCYLCSFILYPSKNPSEFSSHPLGLVCRNQIAVFKSAIWYLPFLTSVLQSEKKNPTVWKLDQTADNMCFKMHN